MGFLDDLFGSITGGTEQGIGQGEQQAAQTALQNSIANAGTLQNQANQLGQQFQGYGAQQAQQGQGYDIGAQQSMGQNAADMLQKSQTAGAKVANQQAQQASTQAGANAASAGRATGLNAAQAAGMAGQGAAGTYTNTLLPAQQMTMNQYNQNAAQFGQQGQNMANRVLSANQQQLGAQQEALGAGQLGVSAAGTMGNLGTSAQQMGQNQQNALLGGIEALLPTAMADGGDVNLPVVGSVRNMIGGYGYPLAVESGEKVESANALEGGKLDVESMWKKLSPYLWGKIGGDALLGKGKDEAKTAATGAAEAVPAVAEGGAEMGLGELAAEALPLALKEGGDYKVGKVMHEYKEGSLHSGSKNGPQVTNPKQAVAIAMSEAGKAKKASDGIDIASPAPQIQDQSNLLTQGMGKLGKDLNPANKMGSSTTSASGSGGTTNTSSNSGGSDIAGTIGKIAPLIAMAAKDGGDFIVPPGYDNDTFPISVAPGTRVKVTPKNVVQQQQGKVIPTQHHGSVLSIIQELVKQNEALKAQLSQGVQ